MVAEIASIPSSPLGGFRFAAVCDCFGDANLKPAGAPVLSIRRPEMDCDFAAHVSSSFNGNWKGSLPENCTSLRSPQKIRADCARLPASASHDRPKPGHLSTHSAGISLQA